jgi:hypothetical protein
MCEKVKKPHIVHVLTTTNNFSPQPRSNTGFDHHHQTTFSPAKHQAANLNKIKRPAAAVQKGHRDHNIQKQLNSFPPAPTPPWLWI